MHEAVRWLSRLSLLGLLLSVAACGWHLRGTLATDGDLRGVRLAVVAQDGTTALQRRVTDALEAAGTVLRPASDTSVPRLQLYAEDQATRIISAGDATTPEAVELRYRVEWGLQNAAGESLTGRTTFEQVRDYQRDPNAALASERRQQDVVEALRRDFVQQVRDRVQGALAEEP